MEFVCRGLKWLWYHRNYIIIVVTPLILLPLPIVFPTSVSVCAQEIMFEINAKFSFVHMLRENITRHFQEPPGCGGFDCC